MAARTRRLIVAGLLFAGIGGALVFWVRGNFDRTDGAGTRPLVRVRKDKFVRPLVVSGELAAVSAVRITSPPVRGGPVAIRYLAPEGALIRPGDLLVQIDNATLVTRLVTEELNLERAENELVKKEAELESQLRDLDLQLAQHKLELEKARLKVDIDPKLVSRWDWQEYQFAFQKAQKQYDKTQETLELTKKAASEEIALLKTRRQQADSLVRRLNADIGKLEIRAERPGTVLYEIYPPSRWVSGELPRKFQVGDQVFSGATILSLPDLVAMEVRAYVSEVDGGLLRPGLRARIFTDSRPDLEFSGIVEHIPEIADRFGKGSNVRVFVTTIRLDRTDPTFMRPGMSVRAEIILEEQTGLVLPRNAVIQERNKYYVRLPEGEMKEIRVRARNPAVYLIEGLPEGLEVRR